ncbi:MAG TPA: hypothetical protein VMI75_31220 [Polyangiaceae bacterium]|nr:hypothetical protein [Polyangiaceae bacterium]
MDHGRRIVVASLAVGLALAACPRVARAQDADACIAASESALSLRKAGKLIDARKALATCAAPACPDPVKSSCQQRLQDAERAVPSVVFQVKDGAGNDVPSVKISVDGKPRDERVGAALSLDPGSHAFTFEAPGLPTTTKTLVLVEGVKERPESVTLGAPAAAPTPDAAPAGPAATSDQAPAAGGGGSSQKTIGLIVGGVGIAGLAVGSVFGLMASSEWSQAQKDGDESKKNTADSQATISTIGFIAGGVLVAGGAILWLTAPSASSSTTVGLAPSVGPGGGGALLRGTF